jgi:hypothetical protein
MPNRQEKKKPQHVVREVLGPKHKEGMDNPTIGKTGGCSP